MKFGNEIALNGDGNRISIASEKHENSPRIWIYDFDEATNLWVQNSVIEGNDASSLENYDEWQDRFGKDISMSDDGRVLAFGGIDFEIGAGFPRLKLQII